MKRIVEYMSVSLIHHGHVRLIKRASEYGEVIIGLTTDDVIELKKGYPQSCDTSIVKKRLKQWLLSKR